MKMWTFTICLFVIVSLVSVVERGDAATVDDCPASVPRNEYLQVYQNWCFEFVFNKRRFYDDAAKDCVSRGGTLALLKSQDIQDYIDNQVYEYVHVKNENSYPLWIGLNDKVTEQTFVWEDGTPLAYSNWGVLQGTGHLFEGTEDCVAFDPFDGTWIDEKCESDLIGTIFGDEGKPYICQYDANASGITESAVVSEPPTVSGTVVAAA